MAKIGRFEDLEAWRTARGAVQGIYRMTVDGAFAQDIALRDQIGRAAVSMMANVAEGFSRHSNREFVPSLFMAKASAAEVQSHLYVALDQGYFTQEQFTSLYQETDRFCRQVSGLITYLLGRQHPKPQLTQQSQ